MFSIHLRTSIRRLVHNRNYTIINIAGLAVGIAVCLIIFLIIQNQTSFDNFHSKKDRIYRVLTGNHYKDASDQSTGKDVPFPLPSALKSNFSHVEQVAPVFASHDDKILVPDSEGVNVKAFKENKGVFFTGTSFFRIFDFPLLAGSYESLNEPNNVILTRETAERYFGDWKTAIGRIIKLEVGGYIFEHGTEILRVSGILETIPANTDFQLKIVVAYGTGFTGSLMAKSTDWEDRTNSGFGCYILLTPGYSREAFNRQLGEYSKEVQSPQNNDTHFIQALSEVHFDTQTGNYSNRTISHQLVNVLWLIAAFILLIACVNFINLSTAQALNRAKETGVRKVLGSSKIQLQLQFIIETLIIVICAVTLAAVITILVVPYINWLLELSVTFRPFGDPDIALFILILCIIVTALASFYPALVLSRFSPVDAIRSRLTVNSSKGLSLRRGLVVFQFIIAQVLIIGTLIIVRQMNFFMERPLGFDKEAIINIPFRVDTVWFRKGDYLKQQLLSVNGVKSVSFSSNTPVEDGNDMWSTLRFDNSGKDADFKAITKFADEEYVSTYKLQLIAGRNLQPSKMTREFIVNESLMKSLGIKDPEEILNREISIWGDRIKCPVVGVLKDFNDRSFRHDLAPLLITTNITMYSEAGIKLDTKNFASTLREIKTIWEQTLPNFVYEFRFLDEKVAGFYKQEEQLEQLYKIFASIAIFLSCLGLYGLAFFMAVQRTKEVGIRKVHGASATSIVVLFAGEFVLLIAVALAFAVPVAWYYMHAWLQGYAYRINISLWIFVAGGLMAVIIALVTISFQAFKAAFANPVNSLRSE